MTMDANLYGTKRVVLPAPRFIVFYNGEADQPDRQILKLSDLYTVKEEDPMLDLKVLVLNVNQGNDPEMMEVCHTLWEYAEYTAVSYTHLDVYKRQIWIRLMPQQ